MNTLNQSTFNYCILGCVNGRSRYRYAHKIKALLSYRQSSVSATGLRVTRTCVASGDTGPVAGCADLISGFFSILLCMIVFNSEPVMAFEWERLWLNENQRAAAKYKAQDYAAAEKLLDNNKDVRSLYNKGNALARQGRYREAIAAYERVLSAEPEHEDAKYNKELLEQELEQQSGQPSPSDRTQDRQQDAQSEQNRGQPGTSQSGSQQSRPEAEHDQDKTGLSEAQEARPGPRHDREQTQNSEQQPAGEDEEKQASSQQTMQEQDSDRDHDDKNRQFARQSVNTLDEAQQAAEQWLRRIPDDPSGLLRRKFRYQYQQQKQKPDSGKYW